MLKRSIVCMLYVCLVAGYLSAADQTEGKTEKLSKKDQDRQAILAMAGTYVVDFHFEETVSFEIGYETKPAYDAGALEVVIVDEETEDKIVLQHILQTERGIVKHWRQDWLFENTELLEYQGDQVWVKREITAEEAKGSWTQRVFQVDDSPRYESLGTWVHMGNLSQWESAETHRPLPRREYSKRDDYNILAAKNRHALTQTGWVHEQDNYKLRRTKEGDHIIAREFGLNRYDRTHDSRCSEARQWWRDHRQFWVDVRKTWASVRAENQRIALRKKVDDKPMYRHIFEMSDEMGQADSYDAKSYRERIAAAIESFMVPEGETIAASAKY